MFSPAYARARRATPSGADPFEHCALNICLYGPTGAWAFPEFRAPAEGPGRGPDHWQLGRSHLKWRDDGVLEVVFDERRSPFGQPLRGSLRLTPGVGLPAPVCLDAAGRHRWWPAAARSRAEVSLVAPALSFSGSAYFDSNWGDEPLEAGFSRWTWCRGETEDGVAILYDTCPRQGPPVQRGFHVRGDGSVDDIQPAQHTDLPTAGWRVFRDARSDDGRPVRLLRTLEDTPFYNRNLLSLGLAGQPVTAVHEALDLDRFATGWVQFLLPFRIRREGPRP